MPPEAEICLCKKQIAWDKLDLAGTIDVQGEAESLHSARDRKLKVSMDLLHAAKARKRGRG